MKRLLLLALLAGCSHQQDYRQQDLGIAWVRSAAEYEALALQAYGEATRDLPQLLANTAFSALPSQLDAQDLPPAIILDVDETVLSHGDFQVSHELPFSDEKLDAWNRENPSHPIPGASDFIALARANGVAVFFVTNRPCMPSAAGPCPQELTTITDLRESGIEASADSVWLAREQPDWTKEKSVRRDAIAKDYRIIMLFGDDLGDFLPCVRAKAVTPCTDAATRASRSAALRAHAGYLGEGWYVLPNPMHGSWTSFEKPL